MKRKNAAAMGRRDAPGGILQKILASKRREVDRLRIALDAKALERTVRPTPRRFAAALRRPGPGFIFEYKRGSPSLGQVSRDRPLGEVAAAYRPFADAVSVLTDREYFDGDFSDLAALRREVAQPILCKDFIIDEIQVLLARRAGADAILLILSSLTDRVYERLSRTARALDMDVLTEVHTADEMTRAGALGATLIGINNRNLSSLLVSPEVTRRLAPLAPAGAALVSESGIQTRRDIVHLAPLVDAFLIGSALMRSSDLAETLRHLVFGDVKICGLRRPQDARAAHDAGASLGGLIFVPGTPRAVNYAEAKTVIAAAPLRWVGVFRDAPLETVAGLARQLRLFAVQLHGHEKDSYRQTLRSLLPPACEIWQAARIDQHVERSHFPCAERILLDSHQEGRLGGTGQPFDWRLLDSLPDKDRLGLAGGIRPDNVPQAVLTGVGLIDVGSGVEEAPGIKSAEKISALFSAIRATAFKAFTPEAAA